jgi:predicted transcriptional regulator
MAESSRDRDPVYSLHFSQAAAEAAYLLRVTQEPLVAIRALSTIEAEARKVLAEMVAEARKADHTWAQIAEAVGVTRQAAQARFRGGDAVEARGASKRSRPAG